MEAGIIEVAPLAYMRGRTLNDAFIILDEAQNTTAEQMKMFLTRLGLRLEDRRHRRRHPGRPARRHDARACARSQEILDDIDDIALLPPDRAGRGPAPAGRRHRRRLRPWDAATHRRSADAARRDRRSEAADEHRGLQRVRASTSPRPSSSRRAGSSSTQMHVHPQAELSMVLVDTTTMADLHVRWMDLPGPTDVMSFPMDELRPGRDGTSPDPARRCSATSCCARSSPPSRPRTAGHSTEPRAAPADRARRAAPARLRPRRARRGEGDVRAAAHGSS